MQILTGIGFEFGEVAQLTDEWENRFDQLLDWIQWNTQAARDTCGISGEFSWVGADWGARGGPAARELSLWVQLQREFRRRYLLPIEGVSRLEVLGFEWEPQVRHMGPWHHTQYGRPMYCIVLPLPCTGYDCCAVSLCR